MNIEDQVFEDEFGHLHSRWCSSWEEGVELYAELKEQGDPKNGLTI